MSVYFAEAGGYTKIGYSHDPIKRSTSLTRRGVRPDDLPYGAKANLIGWIPGDTWTEGSIHGRFMDRRVKGEWFNLIDREQIEGLIWDDPRGVSIRRMSAFAVLMADKHPALTRDELEAAGVPILARSFDEAADDPNSPFNLFAAALDGVA